MAGPPSCSQRWAVLPARGFATSRYGFERWVAVLMDAEQPVGGSWNLDADNREPPPRTATLGVEPPWWPVADDIDAEVRADLDRWQRPFMIGGSQTL